MANLGLQNNNPGNLRDPSTGKFQVFSSPEEGHQALIKDIQLKQSGGSQHIKPGASIEELGNVWAPPSDNNIKGNWASNVAKFLGVPTAYAFDQIPPEKLAEGIKVAEGTSSMKADNTQTSPTSSEKKHLTHEQLTENINAMEQQGAQPDEIQNYLDSLKSDSNDISQDDSDSSKTDTENNKKTNPSLYTTSPNSPERIAQYQKEQEGYDKESKDANSFGSILGNTVQGIGDNLTFGGASQLGEQLGTGFAKTTNQVRGLLGGTDNSKYMEDMSFGKTTAGLTKTLAGILASAAPELKGVLAGPSALESSEVLTGVKNGAGISSKIFSSASPIEKYDYLHEALKNVGDRVSASQLKAIQNAINELEPTISKLIPGGSKIELGNALKWGAKKAGGGLWNLAKAGGLVELGRGGQDIKGLLGLNNLTK